jgi:hypothetical protein
MGDEIEAGFMMAQEYRAPLREATLIAQPADASTPTAEGAAGKSDTLFDFILPRVSAILLCV